VLAIGLELRGQLVFFVSQSFAIERSASEAGRIDPGIPKLSYAHARLAVEAGHCVRISSRARRCRRASTDRRWRARSVVVGTLGARFIFGLWMRRVRIAEVQGGLGDCTMRAHFASVPALLAARSSGARC
jgi:hypothetical protein